MLWQVISLTSVFTSARLSSEPDQHCWLGVLRRTCPTRRPGERFPLSPPCSTHSSSAGQRKLHSQKSCHFSVVKSFVATASERTSICAMMWQVISRTSVFTSACLSSELDQHCWLGVRRRTCPTRRPGARFHSPRPVVRTARVQSSEKSIDRTRVISQM